MYGGAVPQYIYGTVNRQKATNRMKDSRQTETRVSICLGIFLLCYNNEAIPIICYRFEPAT